MAERGFARSATGRSSKRALYGRRRPFEAALAALINRQPGIAPLGCRAQAPRGAKAFSEKAETGTALIYRKAGTSPSFVSSSPVRIGHIVNTTH